MVAQVSVLYMLLSMCVGWTLGRGRKPQSRPLQWERSPTSTAVAVGGGVLQVRSVKLGAYETIRVLVPNVVLL